MNVVENFVSLAVITFNSGMVALRPQFGRLGMECGPTTATFGSDSKNEDWGLYSLNEGCVVTMSLTMRRLTAAPPMHNRHCA